MTLTRQHSPATRPESQDRKDRVSDFLEGGSCIAAASRIAPRPPGLVRLPVGLHNRYYATCHTIANDSKGFASMRVDNRVMGAGHTTCRGSDRLSETCRRGRREHPGKRGRGTSAIVPRGTLRRIKQFRSCLALLISQNPLSPLIICYGFPCFPCILANIRACACACLSTCYSFRVLVLCFSFGAVLILARWVLYSLHDRGKNKRG